MGLRMESGKQAIAINRLAEEIFEHNHREGIKHLKEELGHRPLEVLIGLILAFVVAFIGKIIFF